MVGGWNIREKCRLTVCQLVLITDVPKNPKKGKIVLQLMFRVWILLRRRGVVVPTFPLTTTSSALNVINQKNETPRCKKTPPPDAQKMSIVIPY